MALEISLLGRPGVRRDGVVVAAPRGHKVWGLLTYLTLSDRPVARTRAAALLFPDAGDPLAALRWNLHQLRRLLGAEVGLHGDPITVRLAPTAVLDVTVLRSGSWRQASLIADPGAELLAGLSFAGCPGFEAWLTAERRHLHSVAEAVLHESVLARLAAGQADQAMTTAAALVSSSPYDEGLQELYVRCLLAAGDRVGARRQRQAAIDLIRQDLGVSPGAGLLAAGRQPFDDGTDADPASIAALCKIGLASLHAGSYESGLATMRRAVAAARRGNDRTLLRALVFFGHGLAVSSLGGGAEAATVQHEAMALASALSDDRLLGVAQLQYALTETLAGQYSRALYWADLSMARCVGDPVQAARVRTIRGTAMVDTGRYDEGIEQLETAIHGAPISADPCNAAYALSMLGKAHLLRGEFAAAAASLDQAIDLSRIHWIAFRPWPESLRAEVALSCGQLDLAQQMFEQAYALARNLFDHSPCWASAAARGLGLVAAAHGAVEQAVAWFDDAYRCRNLAAATYQWARCNALDSLCDIAVAHSMPAAPAWLTEFEEQAGRFGMHGFLTRSVQHRARLGYFSEAGVMMSDGGSAA